MKMKISNLLGLFLLFISGLSAQISGTVFRDFNGDGIRQSGEPLISDIKVKAYAPGSSIACGSAITNAISSPNYSISGCSGNVRIEFEIPSTNTYPNGPLAGIDFSSFIGTNNGSSVQFVTANQTNVDYCIFYPGGFSNQSVNNIKLTVPTYNSGDITNSGSNAYNDKAIITFPYLASGREDQADQSGTDNYTTATAGEIGSTWGLAYQKDKKRLFASTLLKRHVGLTTNGVGVIWKIDMTDPTNAGNPAVFYDFGTAAGTVGTNTTRDIQIDKTENSVDVEAWSKAGKVGFGDIEISDDNKILYVVNLNDRKVYSLDATVITASSATALPNYPDPGCVNGVTRPWALKYWRGKLYLGVICDASSGGTRSNLSAYVYAFNPTTNTWNTTPIITFPLDYNKGSVWIGGAAPYWNPWTDNFNDFEFKGGDFYNPFYHPQPILSDIEFDEEGSMHLAFVDRSGFQTGHRNALPTATTLNKELASNNGNGISSGDILRTYLNPTTGLYELEEDGKAGIYTSSGSGTGISGYGGVNSLQGPSKNNPGEFYWDDQVSDGWHSEISVGGLVYVPGQKEIVLFVFDPITLDAGGVESFSITDGSSTRRYQTYYGAAVDEGGPGKANGMGDIEILGDAPSIEIGNRVWNDTDNDGIQDPGEAAITGVTVQLVKTGSVIATAQTDANGNYYFSSGTGINTASVIYGITQLMPNMAYTLRIPSYNTQTALANMNPTTANTGGAGQPDVRDSDGAVSGSNVEASILTTDIPINGANNHTFDFGFAMVNICSTSGIYTTQCNDNGTPANSTDDWFTLTVTGTVANGSGTYVVKIGAFTSPVTMSGTPVVISGNGLLGNPLLQANGSSTYIVRIEDATDSTCFSTITVGPVQSCSNCPDPNCFNVTKSIQR